MRSLAIDGKARTRRRMVASGSSAGAILTNSSLEILACNSQAIQIINYPDKWRPRTRLDGFLPKQLRSKLVNAQAPGQSLFVTELKSGRRLYRCRAFFLDHQVLKHDDALLVLLLERQQPNSVDLSQLLEHFNFTVREREAVELLLQGLTNKEIACRMNISPNTVKAFVRLIMMKMGVSTRSAVVGKVVAHQTFGGNGIAPPVILMDSAAAVAQAQ